MRVPDGLAWEVVVVDNGSSDNTAEVVESYAGALQIRRIVEPEPGLSNARNRAVAEAKGVYIVWTDDDVLVRPDWLASYVAGFDRYPDCAVFGGKITPVLEQPTPSWFTENLPLLTYLLAERDFGETPIPLAPANHVIAFGANFAIRMSEQRRHLYDSELGVGPNRRRSGEETLVMQTILQDGASGMWLPDAEVLHQIPTTRQTKDYVFSYNRAIGETWAYLQDRGIDLPMGPGLHNTSHRVLGAPLAGWRKLLNHGVKYQLALRRGPSRRWLYHLTQFGYYCGVVAHWRREAARRE